MSGVFSDILFADAVERYVNKDHQSDGLSKIPYLYLIFDVICLTRYKIIKAYSERAYKYLTIFNIGTSLMFLLSFQVTLASRISMPFILYFLGLIPLFVEKHMYSIHITRKTKNIIIEVICFVLLIYLITITNETIGKSQFLPYQIFLL